VTPTLPPTSYPVSARRDAETPRPPAAEVPAKKSVAIRSAASVLVASPRSPLQGVGFGGCSLPPPRGELAHDGQPGPLLGRETVYPVFAPGLPERAELEDQALRRGVARPLDRFLLVPAEGRPPRRQHGRPVRFRKRHDDAAVLDEPHAPRRPHAYVITG
jgi:hypothetical protein